MTRLTDFDVGVLVDELDELLEAEEAALAALEHAADALAGGPVVVLLDPALDVLHDDPDELDEGHQEGAEGHRAQVVADQPQQALQDRESEAALRPVRRRKKKCSSRLRDIFDTLGSNFQEN